MVDVAKVNQLLLFTDDLSRAFPFGGIARHRFRGGHPSSGAHFDDLLDCVLDVLAYLLQRDVDVFGGIIGHSPAAALLGVRVLVAEDCPPCNHLAVLVLETIAVNTHAAALAHLVVIHCVLSPADAA